MPPARKSANKSSARSGQGARASGGARSSGTRREVEQSIARFEKRLDEANDALKTLGGHLGSGARGSYKEVTAALGALRRNAAKTNKQALKDFDKVRSTASQANASSSRSSRSTRSGSGSARSSSRTTSRSKTSRSNGSRAAGSRSASARPSSSRSTSSRSSSSRSSSGRSTGSHRKKS